jgi:hypothetical protein
VGGKLRDFTTIRLQGKSTPDVLYANMTQATIFCHRTEFGVGSTQCQCDHPLNLRVVNGAWSSGRRLIEQSIEALGNKSAAPLCHALFGHAHLFSDRRVVWALAHKRTIRARSAKKAAYVDLSLFQMIEGLRYAFPETMAARSSCANRN